MRLDKYLKVSRLIKRRTVANDACDAARITVNGKPAKASYQVKIGDVIEIAFEELEEIPDEFETAYSIAESIVRGIDPKELEFAEKRKLEGKIGRRLAGRGFSMDTIHKVVSRILY